MRGRDALLQQPGAWLLLVLGSLLPTAALAGTGVWTSGGPNGGWVRVLAMSPAAPATLYAGMAYGGVFKSTDAGDTWVAANTNLKNSELLALSIDPFTPSTLYVGTFIDGIFKSTDGGATWTEASNGLPADQPVNALAIDPSNPATLYAGMGSNPLYPSPLLHKSTDSGATWAAAGTGLLSDVDALVIDPATPSVLYAGTYRGVYKSTDSGATWATANTGLSNCPVKTLAIDPATPATLYAGTHYCGVFKTTNSGGGWTAVNTGLTHPGIRSLAVNPSAPATLYAGTSSGVFKSTDAGATWAAASKNLTDLEVLAIAISPADPATVFAGTFREGVFRSANSGSTWAVASAGLTTFPVSVLVVDPVTPSTLYAGTSSYTLGGIFKSIDSGATWTTANAGLPYPSVFVSALAVDPSTPSTLFAGLSSPGGIFRSTDAGVTWTHAGLGAATVLALAVNASTPGTLYAGTNEGVFKSTDSGNTWTAPDNHGRGENHGLPRASVNALAIDPSNPATLYAGTGPYIFRSADAGSSWTQTPFSCCPVAALVIDPSTPAALYAGTDGGVFRSTDSGSTWIAASTGLTSQDVSTLVIDPASPATIYAGTSDGRIFQSKNSGSSWGAIDGGLPVSPYQSVNALALDPSGVTTLYAGLSIGSVWQSTPPPGGPASFSGFVPMIVDVTRLAHYTSELQLTNLGSSSATVKLSYTASMGSGAGDVVETVPAGQQVVFPDAISYLRSRGVPIPTTGDQGGTLVISTPAAGVHATVRTSADTAAPQPVGRAGLAYNDGDPAAATSATKIYVYGLRTNDADRSNLAVYNMGPDPVSLKVTLVSGDDESSFEVTAGAPRELSAYGWHQYNGVLNGSGFSSGYAIVERVSGTGPFGAYGVVNDRKTNDGSFIPAFPGAQGRGRSLTVPVLSEVGSFESELILANRGTATAKFFLRYIESLSPAKGPGGLTIVEVAAGRQRIIPGAIDFLRSMGVTIGARGEAGYAGSLVVWVTGVGLDSVFVGARTSSLSPAGGQFGLFYPAVGSSQEASYTAFILGLKTDANNRSNVAAINTGYTVYNSGPITLEFQVLDGSEGGRAVGQPLHVTLYGGQWVQPPRFFAGSGLPNGYVRIRRTAGTAPWYAYGVINDGGNPGERTGDGAYVPMVK